jgi:hypothetical protein
MIKMGPETLIKIHPEKSLSIETPLQKAGYASEIIRRGHYAEKVVFVDGQFGCGKTMLSPIVAAFERVELLTYAYELEYVCSLHYLGKIETDAAVAMARMLTDLQLYNTMMGRETNFRPSDLSSVFRDIDPWRYFKRLFTKGDEHIPARIKEENPILHLTTHNLLGICEPVFLGLGERAVLIEVVRHPLYMVKQQMLNVERILEDPRDFSIYLKCAERSVPFWAWGWEDLFLKSSGADKVIYTIQHFTASTSKVKENYHALYPNQIITIPFECFVLNPWAYMEQIQKALGSQITSHTRKMLKKQKVPRRAISDGVGLKIYRRCGWVAHDKNASEAQELERRWQVIAENASPTALKILDQLCTEYEEKYLGGKITYPRPGL